MDGFHPDAESVREFEGGRAGGRLRSDAVCAKDDGLVCGYTYASAPRDQIQDFVEARLGEAGLDDVARA